MIFSTIQTEINAQGILIITLNRPDKLNALNEQSLNELQYMVDEASTSNEIRGVLITGAGKAFCAGADIQHLVTLDSVSGLAFAKAGQRVFRTLETLKKPSIAAVNGLALGGGCELSLSTTLRIASTKAQLGQPEVTLGLIPGYGGTQRLPRLIGKGRALEMCLMGLPIKADQALAWGLVNAISEPDHLIKTALQCLKKILSQGPYAVAQTMEAIDRGFDLPLDEALHQEAMHFAVTCGTEDKNKGTRAFLEKRDAEFLGK